jgi:hypothetical protein
VIQAAAFTAAGIWAIYNFWYRERYLPGRTDANVTVHLTLDKLGEREGVVALRLTLVIENPGAAVARTLGTARLLYGQRVQRASPTQLTRPPLSVPLVLGEFVDVDRTLEAKPELLHSSIEVYEPFDGTRDVTVRPNGRSEQESLLFVKRGDYAVVTAQAAVSWLPAAFPARKECYSMERQPDGSVIIGRSRTAGGVCRLTTSAASASISLD